MIKNINIKYLMYRAIFITNAILLPFSCAEDKKEEEEEAVVMTEDQLQILQNRWRYFDRDLYFPRGVSVSPEAASAQEIIKEALAELEKNSDLGANYFTFLSEEDSLLQPVHEKKEDLVGKDWRSFIQTWDDDEYNTYIANNVGVGSDEDMIVSKNKANDREYFGLMRLSCFVAGETCSFASQGMAKAMVWRLYGYLIGLEYGKNANSEIMKVGVSSKLEDAEEKRKFFAEFNTRLETIKLKVLLPDAKTEMEKEQDKKEEN